MRAQFIVRLLCGVGLSISTSVCWQLTLQTDRPKPVRKLLLRHIDAFVECLLV